MQQNRQKTFFSLTYVDKEELKELENREDNIVIFSNSLTDEQEDEYSSYHKIVSEAPFIEKLPIACFKKYKNNEDFIVKIITTEYVQYR